MSKFAEQKQRLIDWLSDGNQLLLCSEPGPMMGTWLGADTFPDGFRAAVANRCLRDGLLSYTTIKVEGVRYEALAVNGERCQ